jgi:Zn-dependent membrane protease YugP
MEDWLFYIGIPLILGIWAQMRVKGAFRRYSQVRTSSGLTGAEAAREIMDAAQIRDVDIVQINGMLGDHYDPTQKRLCLSAETYNSASIAAVGVAAHETGHAIQHARAYAPLQWRMTIVPVTQFASQILPFVIIGALWFNAVGLIKVGILCYAVLTVFQLVTLPVEYGCVAAGEGRAGATGDHPAGGGGGGCERGVECGGADVPGGIYRRAGQPDVANVAEPAAVRLFSPQ